MSPSLALFVWFVLLIALLRFDPARDREASWALWAPVFWIFILGSRLPSQWLGMAPQSAEDGSPIDRVFLSVLMLVALGALLSRSIRWASLLTRNGALLAFIAFALLSVCWSDFPL